MKRRRILALVAALLSVVLVTAACSDDSSDQQSANGLPQTLHVGVVPNVSPDKQRAQYEPFRKYLADRLGIDVQLFVATDYAGVVAALVAKKVDLAYLGGLTYVQAAEQAKVTPIVTEIDQETGTPKYPSAIIDGATPAPPRAACTRGPRCPTPAPSATSCRSPSARRWPRSPSPAATTPPRRRSTTAASTRAASSCASCTGWRSRAPCPRARCG